MSIILPYLDKSPRLGRDVFVAPNASLIGDLTAGDECSFWFSSVARADVHWIKIGNQTNIQDLTMLHVSHQKAPLTIGNRVTVGHSCILHGCTIEDDVLIGMGSIVMDHAVIESGALVGAGSLVTEGTRIPSGMLAMGRPAKVIRPLNEKEKEYLGWSSGHYVRTAKNYLVAP